MKVLLLTENINMKSDKRIWSSAKCEWEIRENELWYNQFQYNKKLRKINYIKIMNRLIYWIMTMKIKTIENLL